MNSLTVSSCSLKSVEGPVFVLPELQSVETAALERTKSSDSQQHLTHSMFDVALNVPIKS